MATSDLHGYVLGWDYHADVTSLRRGLSRVAALVKTARAEQRSSLLFDNGDFLTGSPLGDLWPEANQQSVHPMIKAMNGLGYDVATLGNHEFSNGMTTLMAALSDANFPIVSANFCRSDGRVVLSPFVILDRSFPDENGEMHRVRVGVLGLLPPQTLRWEAAHLSDGYKIDDILQTARIMIPQMRSEGAEIVVALAHSGLGEDLPTIGNENVARALARLPGIDAVFAGHTHEAYPAVDGPPEDGTAPIAMAGYFGSHLALIDLSLVRQSERWSVESARAFVRSVAQRDLTDGTLSTLVDEVPELAEPVMEQHERARALNSGLIGTSTDRLHSYFGLIAPAQTLRLVAAAQIAHLHAALGIEEGSLPIVAGVSPFKAGGRGGPENYTDIAAGRFHLRHCQDIYPHPNQLVAYLLTGAELQDWLERSVSLYNCIPQGGRDRVLINPDFPSFNFDVVEGLSYQVDLTQPARFDVEGARVAPEAMRIGQLRLNGASIGATERVLMISNSYRAVGGGRYPWAAPEKVVYRSEMVMSEILATYINEQAVIGSERKGRHEEWGFAPVRATSVLFETSPLACELLADIGHLKPEPLERLSTGFQRFRLWL